MIENKVVMTINKPEELENFVKELLSIDTSYYRYETVRQRLTIVTVRIDKKQVQNNILEWLKRRV